jgi:TatD DNase family protein
MIDTHIHLDEEAYAVDREDVIARQREAGVEAMIVPGVNAASIEGILELCRKHKGYCFPALGFHPQDVFEADWKEQWAIIEQAIRTHRDEIVAIGEIGLDYHYDTTYKEGQQEVFHRQLDLAQELNLPVMIHNRDATEDTIRILKNAQVESLKLKVERPLRGVVHCFNGSKETAQQILNIGFYLGIGGVLTFKNCKLSETLEAVPLERIVLETDGPYLAPTPHRGERNESRLMSFVVDRLAEVYQTTPENIIAQTTANARKLFFS